MPRRRVTPSTPEPRADIAAQVAAMRDPRNPKDATFVARGNEDALPSRARGEHAVRTKDGTFLTNNAAKARAYGRGVDDNQMAKLLGYPVNKADAMKSGASVIQARDRHGAVVAEALTSRAGFHQTKAALARQMPAGGHLAHGTAQDAQARRTALRKAGK